MPTRTARPTDLLALASFARHGFYNEAQTRREIAQQSGKSVRLPILVRQWLLTGPRRLTCISIDDGHILGLASARRRAGRIAWEVDRLLLSRENESARVCTELLSHLVGDAGHQGAQRIFVRLSEESELFPAAQLAGFFSYNSETLFMLRHGAPATEPPLLPEGWSLRPRTAADRLALFRLYSSIVPVSVREAEALTLQEWLANRDGTDGSRLRRELVGEKDGLLHVWLRTALVRGNLHLDVLARPDVSMEWGRVLEAALLQLNSRDVAYGLVPDYLPEVQSVLLDNGWVETRRFRSLAKQLAVRARRPLLVPAGARML